MRAICRNVECSLCVDDFLICYRSKHIHIIERHLQRCLNKLQYWADINGFRFSTSKTVCVHFWRLLKLHLDPHLFLNGMPIPVIEKTKFLGLWSQAVVHTSSSTAQGKMSESYKSTTCCCSHFLGSRSTNTSAPLQVRNKVKAGLWLHFVWLS